jgi:hypothetical protein
LLRLQTEFGSSEVEMELYMGKGKGGRGRGHLAGWWAGGQFVGGSDEGVNYIESIEESPLLTGWLVA